jgi:hypothetical protein
MPVQQRRVCVVGDDDRRVPQIGRLHRREQVEVAGLGNARPQVAEPAVTAPQHLVVDPVAAQQMSCVEVEHVARERDLVEHGVLTLEVGVRGVDPVVAREPPPDVAARLPRRVQCHRRRHCHDRERERGGDPAER